LLTDITLSSSHIGPGSFRKVLVAPLPTRLLKKAFSAGRTWRQRPCRSFGRAIRKEDAALKIYPIITWVYASSTALAKAPENRYLQRSSRDFPVRENLTG